MYFEDISKVITPLPHPSHGRWACHCMDILRFSSLWRQCCRPSISCDIFWSAYTLCRLPGPPCQILGSQGRGSLGVVLGHPPSHWTWGQTNHLFIRPENLELQHEITDLLEKRRKSKVNRSVEKQSLLGLSTGLYRPKGGQLQSILLISITNSIPNEI